jgi:hypothetical protein
MDRDKEITTFNHPYWPFFFQENPNDDDEAIRDRVEYYTFSPMRFAQAHLVNTDFGGNILAEYFLGTAFSNFYDSQNETEIDYEWSDADAHPYPHAHPYSHANPDAHAVARGARFYLALVTSASWLRYWRSRLFHPNHLIHLQRLALPFSVYRRDGTDFDLVMDEGIGCRAEQDLSAGGVFLNAFCRIDAVADGGVFQPFFCANQPQNRLAKVDAHSKREAKFGEHLRL